MVGAWLVLTEPPYATNSGMPSYPLARIAEHLLSFFKLWNTSMHVLLLVDTAPYLPKLQRLEWSTDCTSNLIRTQANRTNITSYCNIPCKRRGTTTATQCGTVKVSLSYILTRHLFAVQSIEENIFCHPCLKALI